MPESSVSSTSTDRTWALVAVGLLALVVVLGIVVAGHGHPFSVDRWVWRHTDRWSAHVRRPLHDTTFVGSPFGLLLMLAVLALWAMAWRLQVRAAVLACGAVLLAGLAAEVAKHAVGRTIGPHAAFAYPSGHATLAAGLAVAFAVCPRSKRARRVTACLAALGAFAVGLGMVVQHSHYATDALGGWALGAGVVLLVTAAGSALGSSA